MKFTPRIDQHIREMETLELCPMCGGRKIPEETCPVCRGAGMVSVATADRWRVLHGQKPKRGPLPPTAMPPKR